MQQRAPPRLYTPHNTPASHRARTGGTFDVALLPTVRVTTDMSRGADADRARSLLYTQTTREKTKEKEPATHAAKLQRR